MKTDMFILLGIIIILFLVVPILIVWRLQRVPLGGDILVQLMWRGAVAGVTGGSIGATLSSFIFGTGAYAPVAYLFWLLITAALGMAFTFTIAALQKLGLNLNLFGRAAIGAAVGILTAWGWVSAVRTDFGGPMNWAVKGVISMIICSGIISGILAGPLNKEA